MKKFIAAAAAKRRGHANGTGNDRGVRFSGVSGRGISRNRNWNAGLTEGRGSGGGGRRVHPNDLVNGGNNDNRGFIFGAGGAERHLDRNFSQRPREEEEEEDEEEYRQRQEGHNIPVVDQTEKEANLVMHSTPTNEAQGKRKNNGEKKGSQRGRKLESTNYYQRLEYNSF